VDDWNESVAMYSASTVRNSDTSRVWEAGANFATGFGAYSLPDDALELVEGAFRLGYAQALEDHRSGKWDAGECPEAS
jgi:hypothetical protein